MINDICFFERASSLKLKADGYDDRTELFLNFSVVSSGQTSAMTGASKIFRRMPFAAPTPNLMLLGRRLIMTGAVEVFQCHHFMVGWPEMIERQEKTHLSQVCLSSQLHHCPVWPEISDESMTGAEIEDEAMDVKYCEPGSNWSVSLKNSPVYCTLSSRFLCPLALMVSPA